MGFAPGRTLKIQYSVFKTFSNNSTNTTTLVKVLDSCVNQIIDIIFIIHCIAIKMVLIILEKSLLYRLQY